MMEQGGTSVFIQLGNKSYEVVQDNKNGWNPEAFKQRYSEVLDRYDYIVGDWGYNQLRLKGFYKDNHPKASRDTAISGMADYINEYCNFGCAYFVLEKTKELVSDKSDKEAVLHGAIEGIEGIEASEAPSKEQQPLREHLSSREHHAKMKQAKEASKAAAREAREAREHKDGREQHYREPKEHSRGGKLKEHREQRENQRENREMKNSHETRPAKEHPAKSAPSASSSPSTPPTPSEASKPQTE
jgi:uncharacterized protein YutD